ncbi:MAG: acetylglutamate kinase [Tissierellaceae bacterium]
MKGIIKANLIKEALPYLKKFKGNRVLIKYGGSLMDNSRVNEGIIKDIASLKLLGLKPIIVHGGGNEISAMLNKLKIESSFVDGIRVSSKECVEVVEMVLAGKINKGIVADLAKEGVKAIGISGKDGDLLRAKKFIGEVDLGFVGEITDVKSEIVELLLEKDYIPVIAPIARDEEGNSYNINADYAAVAIASALKVEKLIFLTDVGGVLMDKDNLDSTIHYLSKARALELIGSGVISGGMIPKVNSCIQAVDSGVSMAHIIDGRLEHPLISEIYTYDGTGTMIYEREEDYEGIIAKIS